MKSRFITWTRPNIVHAVPTEYGWTVYHPDGFRMGDYTDIGVDVRIFAKYGVVIEDNVQIGAGTKIYSEDTIGGKKGPVIIKKGACIGANSVILPNVTIGEGAIVGALCKVTQDVPAGVTVHGWQEAVSIGVAQAVVARMIDAAEMAGLFNKVKGDGVKPN